MAGKWIVIGGVVVVGAIAIFLLTSSPKFTDDKFSSQPDNQNHVSYTGQTLTKCERGACLQNPLPKTSSFVIGNYKFTLTKAFSQVAGKGVPMSNRQGFDVFIKFSALNVGKEYQELKGLNVKLYDNQERQFIGLTGVYIIGENPGFSHEYEAAFNVPSMDSPYVLQIKDKYILIGV